MKAILHLLPSHLSESLYLFIKQSQLDIQEIRLRVNQPIEINDGVKTRWLSDIVFTHTDATLFLNKISDFSLYRLEEELRQGFITIAGGHRIGISGSVVVENHKVKAIHHVSSFNIRIAKKINGIAHKYMRYLQAGKIRNTLIVGPPQSGKTTFLRDIANYCSSENQENKALKTAIVDERSEICASINGTPQLMNGSRIDVLDKCPKAEGMMMFIRSMSPDIIIVDEIGKKADVDAIDEAIHAGVQLIGTIHGDSFADIKKRPLIQSLMEKEVFQRYIILSNQYSTGEVVEILNKKGQAIYQKRVHVI